MVVARWHGFKMGTMRKKYVREGRFGWWLCSQRLGHGWRSLGAVLAAMLGWAVLFHVPLAVAMSDQPAPVVQLTESERAYLAARNPISVCIDPDWWPFEVVNDAGRHVGIAADLLALVAERTGLQFALHVTRTWEESVGASKSGRCLAMSFLNQTPEREKWLIFTEPLLIDPNALVTLEDRPFIADVAQLKGQTIALPKFTAMHEWVTRDFPNLVVVDTVTEGEALGLVNERKVDMTLRSLIVAAHTIKHNGWFNLKISGLIPGYDNRLRVGVLRSESTLRAILDKGIATLTEEDRRNAVDRHVAMELVTKVRTDYTLAKWLGLVLLAVVLTSAWWMRRLRVLNEALLHMAETDALTGLSNRHGLMGVLEDDVDRALRYERPLSVMMVDIDHFKRVNDDHGHLVGDQMLIQLSQLVSQTIRSVDLACRWGGEELVVLCHETPLSQAVQLAERLRERVQAHAFPLPEPLTVSVGVAELRPGDSWDSLLSRADAALYVAKRTGRNRVCVSPQAEGEPR